MGAERQRDLMSNKCELKREGHSLSNFWNQSPLHSFLKPFLFHPANPTVAQLPKSSVHPPRSRHLSLGNPLSFCITPQPLEQSGHIYSCFYAQIYFIFRVSSSAPNSTQSLGSFPSDVPLLGISQFLNSWRPQTFHLHPSGIARGTYLWW